MPKQKVLVGMSGGVDSCVSAALLINDGYEAVGATLQLHSAGENSGGISDDAADARAACDKMGIDHYVIEKKERFSDIVVKNFVEEYENGCTPNPCIICNRHVKFHEMLKAAERYDCEKIATGHYATISTHENGRYILGRAADKTKDQSYVLYMLTQKQLSKILFPLGGLTKAQVRLIAQENGFSVSSKPDSQDICFIPDGDYAGFIENYSGKASPKGDFVSESGEILGRHNGIIRYTLGQRKGLGIALGKPAYVTDTIPSENKVVLGDESALFYRRVLVNRLNFISVEKLNDPVRVTAKLRYRHTEQPATLYPIAGGQVMLEFDEPQRAPTPGQAAVFYDGDFVLGGGTIVKGID